MSEIKKTKLAYEDDNIKIYVDTYEENDVNKGVYGHRVENKKENEEES
jgi:hypothetical protein